MEAKWYVVRTFSGHENKVKHLLESELDDNEQLNDFLNRKLLVEVPVTDWAEHIILKSYKNDEFNVKMISNSNPNLFI